MKSSLKMRQLENKIFNLKSQQQSLRVGLHALDSKTLLGGLLHILEAVNAGAPKKSVATRHPQPLEGITALINHFLISHFINDMRDTTHT